MKTQAIALAVLLCSGAALAQNPLGDDSGPNANDGQCDDTRFENIGVGNSNIVFWEGGRYDGRDASDCRDLLLQGLINWRDGVDPRVDEMLATGDFGDDSGPNANDGQCDDTRFENIGAGNSNIVFWEGGSYDGRDATDCADLLVQGLIAWRRDTAVAGVSAEPEPAPASVLRPGQAFSDALSSGGQGPEMVVIPSGRFYMGCVSGQDCDDDEFPVHDVTIPQAFAVSKYEVTFEDWDRCVAGGGCGGYRPDDGERGRGRRPVIRVSWDHAQEYVSWLSRQTGQTYRLLSEAEWEYVARAGSSTAYSWGNGIGTNRANCNSVSRPYMGMCGDQWDYTAPAGSFAANAFGVHDMHGNVWEWVEDCWNASYAGSPTDGSAWPSGDCSRRVMRGGAWTGDPGTLRSANRARNSSTLAQFNDNGFRVARTLTP